MPDFDRILASLSEDDGASILEIQEEGAKIKDPVERAQFEWDAFLHAFPDRDERIAKFYWIKTKNPDNPIIPFSFNYPQRKMNETIKALRAKGKPVRMVLLKARQFGGSTFLQADGCDSVLTRQSFRAAVIAHKEASTQEIFDMTTRFTRNLPFLPPMDTSARDEIRTRHDSKYTTVTAGSDDTGRATSAHWAHLSEFSRYPDAVDLMSGALQTVGRYGGTSIFIESTANGMGGIGGPFYDLCMAAQKGESDWTFLFIPWWQNEDYAIDLDDDGSQKIEETLSDEEKWLCSNFKLSYNQIAWRRSTMKTECFGNPQVFQVEYPAFPEEAFLHSGRPVFDLRRIMDLMKLAKEPIWRGQIVRRDKPVTVTETEE